MSINKVLFSSNNTEWETPQQLFDMLNIIFHFDIDVCATKDNAKCVDYWTKKDDALSKDWVGCCWMNPPYGRGVDVWVKKAYDEAKKQGSTVVCLLPARVDTKWWHNYCSSAEYKFIKGRLKFSNNTNSAPFPSVLVVFRPSLKDITV
jgi:phage N-6-adenine-methyltransferase